MNLVIYFHLLYINLNNQYFVGCSGIKSREPSDNSKNMPEIQSYNPNHVLKQQSSEDNDNIDNFKYDKKNKNVVNPIIVEYKEFLRTNERIQNDMLLEFHLYLFSYGINEKNSKIICNVFNSLKDEDYFLRYLRYFITSLISINEKKIKSDLFKHQDLLIKEKYLNTNERYPLILDKFISFIDSYFILKYNSLQRLISDNIVKEMTKFYIDLYKYSPNTVSSAMSLARIHENNKLNKLFKRFIFLSDSNLIIRRFILLIINSFCEEECNN